MPESPTIVWFRQDLRLADNPALLRAAESGAVVPVYIWSPGEEGRWPPGGASRWWLDRSLRDLAASLEKMGSRLTVRTGETPQVLQELIGETGAERVVWNRRYEPVAIERDAAIKAELTAAGVGAESFNASLLHEPWTVETKQGKPFQVFTPFWKACRAQKVNRAPLPAPEKLHAPAAWPGSLPIDGLCLAPEIRWDAGLCETWDVGERAAVERLGSFIESGAAEYKEARNQMGDDGVSMLSPHLHFGEIGPRQVWAAAEEHLSQHPDAQKGVDCFLSEIGWREFGYHLLYHFPETTERPLREKFAGFPWKPDAEALEAWRRGRTGFPVVDAAMRQLWHTGWMHNRARMIVASVLTKDLLVGWQDGAAWFWDTLVDADLASNTQGWQWTAGCGADASPFFRVFNPVSQSTKFDPRGDYIRRWVPELAGLDPPFLYKPDEAPAEVLAAAGVRLGETYPLPIVDHAEARRRALDAYEAVKAAT